MQIKGAIFDMDGTLIDSLSFWGYFWGIIGKRYLGKDNFAPDCEIDVRVRTMIYRDATRAVKDYYGIGGSVDIFLAETENLLPDFYKNFARPKDGAIPLLTALKAQGISLCLASATAMKEVRFVLRCHGIDSYLDTVVSCADIGVGKERPDIYLLAARRMGLSPAEIAVFEDSYVALETARNAGFHTVGIYDRHNRVQDRLAAASEIYLGEGRPLSELIPLITA